MDKKPVPPPPPSTRVMREPAELAVIAGAIIMFFVIGVAVSSV